MPAQTTSTNNHYEKNVELLFFIESSISAILDRAQCNYTIARKRRLSTNDFITSTHARCLISHYIDWYVPVTRITPNARKNAFGFF